MRVLKVGALVALLLIFPAAAALAQTPADVTVAYGETLPPGEGALPQTRLYVTVTDANHAPLTSLTLSDFTLIDGATGEALPLASAAVSLDPITLILVQDTSGSLAYIDVGGKDGLQLSREASIQHFVNAKSPDDVFVIYGFNQTVTLARDFSTSAPDITTAIQGLDYVGQLTLDGTCFYDAVREAVGKAADVSSGFRAIVAITDGVDETWDQSGPCSRFTLDEVAEAARDPANSVPVYTLGFGGNINPEALRELSARTGGVSVTSPDAAQVNALFERMAGILRGHYVLTLEKPLPAGTRTVIVQTAGGEGRYTLDVPDYPVSVPPAVSMVDEPAIDASAARLTVNLLIQSAAEIASAEILVDGKTRAIQTVPPFERLTLDLSALPPGPHEITARIIDVTGGVGTAGAVTIDWQPPASPEPRTAATPPPEPEAPAEAGGVNLLYLLAAGALLLLAGGAAFLLLTRRASPRLRPAARTESGRLAGAEAALAALPDELDPDLPRVRLVIVRSPGMTPGAPIVLFKPDTLLGSGPESDVRFPRDTLVSGAQAEILIKPDSVSIRRVAGETGGTTEVDRVPVGGKPFPLKDGAMLSLSGNTLLRLEIQPPLHAAPTARGTATGEID